LTEALIELIESSIVTETFEFKQSGDLDPALSDPATRKLSADKLVGRWVNTDPDTRGIAVLVIERNDEHFDVSIQGVGADGLIDWPRTRATPLANLEEEAGQRAVALAADFDLSFMRAETYLRANKGVLVIVLYVTFQDDSGRSNYLNREFFYRQDCS
jgi:hypothetical protein